MKVASVITSLVFARLCLCADSAGVLPRGALGVLVAGRVSESVRESDSRLIDDIAVIPIGSAMVVYEHWTAGGSNLRVRIGLGYERFRTRWNASSDGRPSGYFFRYQSDYEFATVSAACVYLPIHIGVNLSLPISTFITFSSRDQPHGSSYTLPGWSQVSVVAGARYSLTDNTGIPADLLIQASYGWGAGYSSRQLVSASLGIQVLFPV